MTDPTPDWMDRLRLLMPRHDCGRRMEPGGLDALGPLLVCVPCSYIEQPDPEWVDAVMAEATEDR